jgi:hypothetical protein
MSDVGIGAVIMSKCVDPVEQFMQIVISRMEHLSSCKRELHVQDCTCNLDFDKFRMLKVMDLYSRQVKYENETIRRREY